MKPDPIAADPIQEEAATARIGLIASLTDLPAVEAYLRRVGARPINFKTAKVEEVVNGYPKPIGTIRFDTKGAVSVEGDATPPTEAEMEAIKSAFHGKTFPKPITLAAIADPPPNCNLKDHNTFICHDFNGQIVMVHQRYQTQDGGKGFLPWTRWTDGEWRKMEPDVMPFYGLPGYKEHSTLYIHEGAKAADRIKRQIAGTLPADRSPWLEHMRHGHHIGWIGGIHAVDRSDWHTLAKQNWKRVIIVADNDDGGTVSGAEITGEFRCPTFMLRFDSSFPEGFDCGDPWPDSHFDANGAHIGVSFNECLQPFDRATDRVSVIGDNGRPRMVPVLRDGFAQRYRVAAQTQEVFCVHRPAIAMDKQRFNDEVRPRSDAADTYALLIREPQAVCARRVYRPDRSPGPVIDNNEVCWNAYQPSLIRPVPGDVGPWLDYLSHLFPVETDRHEVMRWLATLIACRDRRMHYSLLLVSRTQGVGKSTLGLILNRLLGEDNVSEPGDNSIDNQFNSWALGKLLIFVNEIYSNGNTKVYDKLKSYITENEVPINLKHVKQFWVQNWAVFVACSNSQKALFLPDEDRRWLVPTVTNELKPRAWWVEFHAWFNAGGASAIRAWADRFAGEHGVMPGERPAMTTAKRAIIKENKSAGRLLAQDFAEEFAAMEPAIVRVGDVRAWIADRLGPKHEKLETERTIISELEKHDGLHVLKGDARPKIGGRAGNKASVVLNFAPGPNASWPQMEDKLCSMEKLGFVAPM
jgi:hypothetical protein